MPRVTERIKTLFDKGIKDGKVNNAELLARYTPNMECQINVAVDNGELVEGKHNCWTDGEEEWWHIRVPKKAMTEEPIWHDYELEWSLAKHAEAIGLTGWDWASKRSKWVAFDFDSITGHAAGIGVTKDELQNVQEAACQIPWVETRLSTRGKGLHLYVYFCEPTDPENQGVPTKTHTHHQALARTVLGMMSRHAGFDFSAAIDACGGNMWVWHRDATKDNHGYAQIKAPTQIIYPNDLPENWEDNVEVVTRKRSKQRVRGIDSYDEDDFDSLANARSDIKLTPEHDEVINDLAKAGFTAVWHQDYRLLQTHTFGLKQIMGDNPGKYNGYFDTLSEGGDPGKPNCLAGNTMVVTRKGLKPIRDLTGHDVEVITSRGKWVTAPFKSYGEQQVFAITLQHGTDTKVIKATGDHGWFVCNRKWDGKKKLNLGDHSRVVTLDLVKDQVLITTQPRVEVTPSIVGIQHGLVWGDGTNGGQRTTSALSLFGDKGAQLLKFFNNHPQRPLNASIGGTEVGNLPYHFKSLVPLDYDKPYLYGWLAGYFAADGCVGGEGNCCFNSADIKSLEHVQHVCSILGIRTNPIRAMSPNKGRYNDNPQFKLGINRGDLTEEFFLIEEHRRRATSVNRHNNRYWRVVSVEPAGAEEVFCCTVEDTHCFVLEDFILTGNCFGFPLPGRGWKFYRFGKDVKEHESWERQDNGWISTFFDRKPTLDVAARVAGGSELSEGGYAFDTLEEAVHTLKMLGVDFEVNLERFGDRKAEIKVSKREGRIVLRMKQLSKDENKPDGNWNEKRGGWWETVVRGVDISSQEEVDYERWDKIVRCTSSPSGEAAGWYIHDENGSWIHHPLIHVNKVLGRHGLKSKDQDDFLGYAVQASWSLVNLPFQAEYPGKRQWNFRSAQWKYDPAQLDFEEKPKHPHWDQILDHIGQDLEGPLRDHAWAQRYGVRTGRHYLQLWIASLLRFPFDKLPYLFLFSRDENTGKSTLHQAISRLITGGGVEFADRALRGDNDFNGELANCVLAIIEEVSPQGKDVARARARMKDWTTNDYIAIRQMRTDVYRQRNTLHFIQCSNNREDCLVSFGDTRTTMIHVPSLAASDRKEIPHAVLMQQLDAEAPHFMRTLCDLEIPPPESRLRIPFINTSSKRRFEEEQRTDLEVFLQERCTYKPGASVIWKEFYNKFLQSLSEDERGFWNKRRVSMGLPEHYPTGGFDAKNTTYVGNLIIDAKEDPSKEDLRKVPLVRDKGRLKLKDDVENAN